MLPKPLLEWGFEESGTTVTDYTGNGYDFTATTSGLKVQGHTGNGLQARTTYSSPNYKIPSVGLETTSRTMMVWVKRMVDANDGQYQHTIWFENDGSSVWTIASEDSSGNIWFRAKGVGVDGLNNSSAPRKPVGEWHHYAMTFSPTTGVRTYIDGALHYATASNFMSGITTSGGPQANLLNVMYEGTNRQVIDDVRLYDVALTDTQIVEAMNTPAAPYVAPSTTITLWDGTQEVPVSINVWNGSQELPVSIEIA